MKRNFKNGMLTGAALLSMLFICYACTDKWDDHYSGSGSVTENENGTNSNQTLLEIIKADADLSDFGTVLDALGCADSLLNQSRVYTLWVPVNGTFNRDSLVQEVQNGNRDNVMKRFIASHMTNYLFGATGTLKETNNILLLNKKIVPFSGKTSDYKFDHIAIKTVNIRARNGIMHKIEGVVDYAVNIWEYLAQDSELDSISKFLYSFNVRTFNPYGSILGPVVDGEQTYLDSAFINSNQWFYTFNDKYTSGFGRLEDEDSSYIMFAPTDAVWRDLLTQTETYYNYYRDASKVPADILFKRDSLHHFYSRKAICNYLVFSKNEQLRVHPDSMLSTYRAPRRTFARTQLLDGARSGQELSNGTLHITDKFTYSPFELWHDTIKVEAEDSRGRINKASGIEMYYVAKDEQNDTIYGKISNSVYIEAFPASGASKPSVIFTIPETLSAYYNVKVVFVPLNITNKNIPPSSLKPLKLKMTLRSMDGDGRISNLYVTPDMLYSDPARIDTLTMAKVKFPVCEYGFPYTDANVTLEIISELGRTEDPLYQRALRIDCVLLEPVKE